MTNNMPSIDSSARPLTLDDLLREAELARPLAARLIRDAVAADDIVQEAVMIALTRAGAVKEDAGRWFRGIVRNLARQRYRGEGHRAEREQEAARRETVVAADEPVVVAERQRDLLEAVLELPPASRRVVLLRFYENLPPRKIAAKLGEPTPTASPRLVRA